jgi:hypothetical protein
MVRKRLLQKRSQPRRIREWHLAQRIKDGDRLMGTSRRNASLIGESSQVGDAAQTDTALHDDTVRTDDSSAGNDAVSGTGCGPYAVPRQWVDEHRVDGHRVEQFPAGPGHEPPGFTPQRMHEFRELFTDIRSESGMEHAVEYCFESFIDDWLAWIGPEPCNAERSSCSSTLQRGGGVAEYRDTGDWLAYLAVGMAEVLSIRDVLILSLLTGVSTSAAMSERQNVTVEQLKDMACRPHHRKNAALMTGQLQRAFRLTPCACALRRCRNGISALSAMCASVPEEYRVQALAVIAYINWWLGDASAEAYARQALSLDVSCRLASIVICALEHNIHPNGAGKQSFRE